jgi:hypothetical protein
MITVCAVPPVGFIGTNTANSTESSRKSITTKEATAVTTSPNFNLSPPPQIETQKP